MAGGSVGSIFVELDLDTSRYLKSQQKLLQDATSTNMNIEANFRNLGIKSAAEMDLMRAKIQNSFDMIANSSKATANDILRAEEAKNRKLQELNDQQFGAHKSGLDMIKGHYLAVTAAIAVSIGTVTKAWDMAKAGADFEEQQGILDNLSRKYGTTADTIVAEMDRASDHQISKSNLMSIALGGIAKGLNPKQLTDLADAALILGDAVGKDATTALRDLTESLETGRTKGLKTYLGTSLDLEAAFGDLTAKMTAAEKAQAMYTMTIHAASEMQKQQTRAVDTGADSIAQIEKKFDDATLAASRFAKTAVVAVIDGFKNTFMSGNDAADAVSDFGMEIEKAKVMTFNFDEGVQGANNSLTKATAAANAEAEAQKNLVAPYQATIDNLKKQLQTRKDDEQAIKDRAAAAKKAAEDAAKDDLAGAELVARLAAEQIKRNEADLEWVAKMEEAKVKAAEKEIAGWIKSGTAAEEAMIKEIDAGMKATDTTLALLDKRREYEREVYKDLRGFDSQYHDATMALINSQAEKYRAAGVDEVAIAVWVANEKEKALIKQGKDSADFVAGFNSGLLEMKRNAITFGEAGFQAFQTIDASSKTALSSIISGSADAATAWETFSNSMKTKFADVVSEMIVEAAEQDIAMMFKASWTADSSSILGLLNKGWDLISGITGGGAGSVDANVGDWAWNAGGYGSHATGGDFGPHKPFWAGEKGPELIFPGATSGTVLTHEQSVAYAARNGGYIPGFADGGNYNLQNFIRGAIPLWLNPIVEGDTLTGGTLNPDRAAGGWYEANGHWWQPFWEQITTESGDRWVDNPIHGASIGESLNKSSGGLAGIFDTIGGAALEAGRFLYPILMTAAGTAVGGPVGGAFGGYVGGLASTGTFQGAVAGGVGGYFAGATWQDVLKSAATSAAKKYAMGMIMSKVFGVSNSGTLGADFAGMDDNGLFSSLSSSMAGIAPKSSTFGFPLASGLDYVPYDNFPARLHKGERVQTAGEAGGLTEEIKALREEMRSILTSIAVNTFNTQRPINEWMDNNNPVTV